MFINETSMHRLHLQMQHTSSPPEAKVFRSPDQPECEWRLSRRIILSFSWLHWGIKLSKAKTSGNRASAASGIDQLPPSAPTATTARLPGCPQTIPTDNKLSIHALLQTRSRTIPEVASQERGKGSVVLVVDRCEGWWWAKHRGQHWWNMLSKEGGSITNRNMGKEAPDMTCKLDFGTLESGFV